MPVDVAVKRPSPSVNYRVLTIDSVLKYPGENIELRIPPKLVSVAQRKEQ